MASFQSSPEKIMKKPMTFATACWRQSSNKCSLMKLKSQAPKNSQIFFIQLHNLQDLADTSVQMHRILPFFENSRQNSRSFVRFDSSMKSIRSVSIASLLRSRDTNKRFLTRPRNSDSVGLLDVFFIIGPFLQPLDISMGSLSYVFKRRLSRISR
jgi:hypothetical protein